MKGQWKGRHAGLRPAALFGVLALVGILIGASVFTAFYAEAFSYLSDDPETCVNCHVMRPQFEGWAAGPHHAVATCNDCHVPHESFLAKWLGKASNGYHHSRAFTLQDYPDPIRIKASSSEVLEENCIRCHADLLRDVTGHSGSGSGAGWKPPTCVYCHRSAGHGAPW